MLENIFSNSLAILFSLIDLAIFIAQFLTNSPSLNGFLDFAISLEIIYEANKLDCCEVVALTMFNTR